MNYLTNHYRHKAEVLQQKVNLLENRMRATGFGGMEVAGPADADSQFSVGGSVGEETFSGAYLGQLLASGNMQAVRNYLAQFYGNNPSALAAITASLGIQNAGPADAAAGGGFGPQFGKPTLNDVGPGMPTMGVADMAGGPGSQPVAGGPFSGQQLGQYLGSGNMDAANQYVSQYGPNGSYNAGPANLRSRGGRRARVAGMAESVNHRANMLFEETAEAENDPRGAEIARYQYRTGPYMGSESAFLRRFPHMRLQAPPSNTPRGAERARYNYGPYMGSNAQFFRDHPNFMVQAPPAPGVQSGARQGEVDGPASGNTPPFDGAYLGQLLGSGNMDAVNAYISQYMPQTAPAFVRGPARASGGRRAGSGTGRPARRITSGGGFGT